MPKFAGSRPGRARRGARKPALFAAAIHAGLAVLLFGCASARALKPSTPLSSYTRQTWVMESGLPQNSVQALFQTRDGFLWVGTEAGLARFDGSGFRVFDLNSHPALPGNDVRCLLESSDGALWIGTGEGLARWKGGAFTVFTTQDGLPGNVIRALAQSANGELWVWTDLGVARRSGNGFTPAVAAGAFPQVGSPSSESSQAAAFEWLQMPNGMRVQEVRDGLDLFQNSATARNMIHLETGRELPGNRIQAIFADREGALWIGTNAGLVRWVKGNLERFPETDPLAIASVLALFEDREGNLWVGTENDGLHILRDQRFRTLGAREGLSSDAATAIVEDGAGTLWVGTQEDGLNALHRDGADERITTARTLSVSNGLASNVILSLAAAPDGDLWVGTPDGLNRIRGGSVTSFTSADGLPDDFIRSLLVDADGSLWIGTRHGLAHWKLSGPRGMPGAMETYTHASGLGSDLVGAMVRDARGDLWVATLAGLSRLHAGSIENFTTANGLSSNVITALLPRADGTLLIGTQENGWDIWNGREFYAAMQGAPARAAIHAILDDGGGHLWFAAGDGIARCTFATAAPPANACADWMEFSTADGLRSRETATNSHPSAWRTRDGRLWFATPKGLVEIDPANFPINALPPPVALERFAVDDADQPLHEAVPWLKVSAGHVHFQFDYAGLSFIAPQKVRYRYMLEGFDHGWTDAGARRVAYYTNIPPGRYTFRVQAANNDGVWNTAGAAFQFELLPHLYQTLWFYALLLVAVAALFVLLVKARVRLAEREFEAVLGERARIAREIHDTLAQGYAGISVQLELLAELLRLGKVDVAVEQLDRTREHVRQGLGEARQSIWALRTHDADETTLPVKLRRMVEAAGSGGLTAEFRLFGVYRPLPGDTERELLHVAREAVHNVEKHAGAAHLLVQLEYGPEAIALEVRDDGRGGASDADGHFGLTGMKERAAAIGGKLEVVSEPGAGTTIRLSAAVPIDIEQAGAR